MKGAGELSPAFSFGKKRMRSSFSFVDIVSELFKAIGDGRIFLELLWKEEDSALPQMDGIGRVRGNTL